jgi:hypothetical protein
MRIVQLGMPSGGSTAPSKRATHPPNFADESSGGNGNGDLVLPAVLPRITFSAMTTISLKLPERLLALLEKESRARRTTKSALVRECLEQTLTGRATGDQASCYDLARDLAGSVKGLPRDLATNPKYLEGFGR